jgi:hypothetical protein
VTENQTGFVRDARKKIVAIRHQGEEYPLVGLSGDDIEEVKAHIESQRRKPIEAVKEQYAALADTPALQAELARLLFLEIKKGDREAAVTNRDAWDYLDTSEGSDMTWWLIMRKKRPEVTLAQAKQIMREVSLADSLAARDELSVPTLAAGQ